MLTTIALALGTTAAVGPLPAHAHTMAATTRYAGSMGPSAATPGVRTVTLVTGDRVVLSTSADGRTTAALAPGSPHLGRPAEYLKTPTHTWVIPQLAPSVRRKLDNSVFDVAALAVAGNGRVPLSITFSRGTSARSLPGLHVRTSAARTSAEGRTTVTASYDARRPLPSSLTRSLPGVARIAVPGVSSVDVASGYDLHTLTINATETDGSPLKFSDVYVMNLDDARLMGGFGAIVDGQWKVSVPEGHYLVICSDLEHVVVDHPVVGAGDVVSSFSMSQATVQPRLKLADHSLLDSGLDVIGRDASGHGLIDYAFNSLPKVNPVSGLAAGSLFTEVSNLWSSKGYTPYEVHGDTLIAHPIKQVVAAKEVRTGIPHDLSFSYRPSDFAKVDLRLYATGARSKGLDGWFGLSSHDIGAFIPVYPSVRPSVIHAWFESNPAIAWNSLATPSPGFSGFGFSVAEQVYRRAQHAVVPFFRGPVTPVADRGNESGTTGRLCSLCVHSGTLHGDLSMLSAAGTRQSGGSSGKWVLSHGGTRLAHGFRSIAPFVPGVQPGAKLTLTADNGPQSGKWTLSSHVHDAWTFLVPSRNAVVPILRADYVPPTNLHSRGPTGKVSFPVTFDNLGPVDARIKQATVRYSVGGKKWHRATLRRKDANTFRVSYRQPVATRTHRTLSLRVNAVDGSGRTIRERVADAYLLPKASARHSATTGTRHRARFRPSRLCRTGGVRVVSCYVKLDASATPGRATPAAAGWGATALRDAYDLTTDGATTTVAVVVAYDYPHAEADLNHYRAQYGLPPCTSASGCFTKINQNGATGSYPQPDYGWGVEASLDLQMISAACPACHIVLAEADEPTTEALGQATMAAVGAGATVTNHSYGGIETTGVEADAAPYDQPGVTAVSATGDSGYTSASFPASSPQVVAVGGTTLTTSTNPRGWTERAWAFGGSGCSAYFAKPGYQGDPSCHMRTEGEISAVADGLAVYNTSLPKRYRGWLLVGGTSASSPLIAGMIGAAGAGGIRPDALYGRPGDFNDVVAGSNGFCRHNYMCTGRPGCDGPTGWGTNAEGARSLPLAGITTRSRRGP